MKDSSLDPELLEIFSAAGDLYNREASQAEVSVRSADSVNATFFLANQAVLFADAALFILRDELQPLVPPAALLRTCLEAQARANHIVAAVGAEREVRASEFIEFISVGEKYYEAMLGQTNKDFPAKLSLCSDKAQQVLTALKPKWESIETVDLKKLKDRQRELNRKWSYGEVIGRTKLTDADWQKRTEAQSLQPALYVRYIQTCSFVHCDPVSIKFRQSLTRLEIQSIAVIAVVISLLSLFETLGKAQDVELLRIKAALINGQKARIDKYLGI